jgi:hypothetical protein
MTRDPKGKEETRRQKICTKHRPQDKAKQILRQPRTTSKIEIDKRQRKQFSKQKEQKHQKTSDQQTTKKD